MSNRKTLLIVFVVAALIGANFSVIKIALDHTTPLLLAAMRTTVGGVALLAYVLSRGERIPRNKADLGNIFVVALSITTVSSGLLVIGINRVPAGVGSLVASTMPLFTAFLSFFILKSRIPRLGLAGLGVGFAGAIVLASPSLSGSSQAIGILSLTFSAIAWAFGNVYMKWADFSRVSPLMLTTVQLFFSALMLYPIALAFEGTAETDWSLGLLVPLLYAGIPALAGTFGLLAIVVREATPTQAASTAYLIPVFGVFFSWRIRGETLGWIEVVGGILVVCGVFLVVRSTTGRLASDSEQPDVVAEGTSGHDSRQ